MNRSPKTTLRRQLFTSAIACLVSLAGAAGVARGASGADLIAKGGRPLAEVEQVIASASAGTPSSPETIGVSYSPKTHGTWEMLPSGTPLWRLRVRSPGAAAMAFAFSRYAMPPGALLILYSPDGSNVRGPFTVRDNTPEGGLTTPYLPGDEAVLELRPPAGSRPELVLAGILRGGRDLAAEAMRAGDPPAPRLLPASGGAAKMAVGCAENSEPSSPCVPDDRTLCFNNGRFRVTVDWKNFESEEGQGTVVPFLSDDSGLFWFFEANNWEILVKVLNGCTFNEHFWVFSAATTNVEYTLRVTDTEANTTCTYFNSLGTAAPAITDIEAFATCP